jgi:hypothetical protein
VIIVKNLTKLRQHTSHSATEQLWSSEMKSQSLWDGSAISSETSEKPTTFLRRKTGGPY